MNCKDKKQNRRKKFLTVITAVFLLIMLPWTVYAANIKILQTVTYDGSIYIYIRGISEIQSGSVIQIGNIVCPSEQIAVASFDKMESYMRTLVLIDNSKSIAEKNHADIQEILNGIIANSKQNEQIRIGTFSEDVTYLCEYTNDHELLSEAVNDITYQNQDTYLGDVLYNVISELKEEDTYLCTRIVILSDGADDKSIGYTSDEVRSFIEKSGCFLYSVGIPGKNNSSELETMFSFSRAAKTDYFLLDGSISNEEVVNTLLQDQSGICLKITPDESFKDGSSKSILLKLDTAEGEIQLTTSSDMPFGTGIVLQSETEQVEETKKIEETTEAALPVINVSKDVEEKTDKAEQWQANMWVFIALGVVVGLLLIVIGILVFGKKERVSRRQEPIKEELYVPMDTVLTEDTVLANGDNVAEDSARRLWENTSNRNYLIWKNIDNPNIFHKVPIVDVVRVGRVSPSDIILDDSKVSRKHCEIILRGDLMYIRDCGSTNKTYYEGVVVHGEVPIVSGGIVKAGGYRYRVELIKE